MKFFSVWFIVSLAAASAVRADVIPACEAPSGVTLVPFDQVPTGIQKALRLKTGDMALPGQPFNASDIEPAGKPLPQARGIFAWNRGTRWVIATEHGGYGYNDPVYALDVGVDGKSIKLVASKTAFPKTVCAAAKRLLDAK